MKGKKLRALLLLLMAAAAIGGVRTIYRNFNQNIAMQPLPLDAERPDRKRVGQLEFLAAWELRSSHEYFGGISGIAALPGGRFVGLSDAGILIGFGLTNNDRIDRPFFASLPDAHAAQAGYADRDSEGLTFDPVSGRAWASYEAREAIRRFPASFARADGIVRPKPMRDWPGNSGAEAIARFADGRFAVFAEGGDAIDGAYPAILFSGDPVEPGTRQSSFLYRPPSGYRITDATALPDGRLLLLHRRIAIPSGFSAKLALLDPARIVKGETVSAKVIATLAPPLTVDNMEGVTVTEEGGRTIVWLISDNNFNIWQRTLLMKFALIEDSKKPEAEPAPGFDSL